MKKGFQKSLALVLAVFMAFGVTPFALGFAVFAAEPKLMAISISPDTATINVGQELSLQVSGAYLDASNNVISKAVSSSDVYWTSADTTKVTVTSEGVVTGVAPCESVTIIAADKTNGNIKNTCTLKVVKAPVNVDSITWTWPANAFVMGDTFELTTDKYLIIPDEPDTKDVEFTWSPSSAIQKVTDKDGKVSYKVNPLNQGVNELVVTLTLTAKGAGKDCKPATKQMTILRDIPLSKVVWNYAIGPTGKTSFKYYDNAVGATKAKNFHPYKFTAYTTGDVAMDASALSLCEVKITSSDNRVVLPDEKSQSFIPVGNGEATLTITVITPNKSVKKSATVVAVVADSPYTPITVAGIGYDEKNTDSSASYDSKSNTISLMYTHSIQLTVPLNDKATLDQKDIVIPMEDDRDNLKIVTATTHSWKSSNTDVATVDKNGKVTVVGVGTATITLTINDNGKVIEKTVKVKGSMVWWEALMGILMSIVSFNFKKVPFYFKALFGMA